MKHLLLCVTVVFLSFLKASKISKTKCEIKYNGRCIDLNESCGLRHHLPYDYCGFLRFCCFPSSHDVNVKTTTDSQTTTPVTVTLSTHVISSQTSATAAEHNKTNDIPAHCGLSTVNDLHRIVGGKTAQPHEYPWQVSLRYKGHHMCGGTIINNQWILTAAHCLEGTYGFYWSVAIGIQDRNSIYSSQVYDVTRILQHGAYDKRTNKNDIALMKLEKSVDLSGRAVRSVCLPDSEESFERMLCTVTGWGSLYPGGHSQRYLQEVDVPIISNRVCRYHLGNHITRTNICAGYRQGGKDACQGDSGGPLICKKNKIWKIVGVVSWGIGCAMPNSPGIYTRVSEFLEWINYVVTTY